MCFSTILNQQRQIALFSEMVHSASLVHDDVIDQSDYRRGKPSVNALWNHKKVRIEIIRNLKNYILNFKHLSYLKYK